MARKTYDKKGARVWGSPDYLIMRYADIDTVKEYSRNAKAAKEAKAIVGKVSSDLDRLSVYRVYETAGRNDAGPVTQVVVHLSLGLNSALGMQTDYLDALKRLVETDRFSIFDAYVDACDDLADVLCVFRPDLGNADHRKQRGRTAPNARNMQNAKKGGK